MESSAPPRLQLTQEGIFGSGGAQSTSAQHKKQHGQLTRSQSGENARTLPQIRNLLITAEFTAVDDWRSPQNGAGGLDMEQVRSKLDSLKTWSLNTYKCTKQAVRSPACRHPATPFTLILQVFESLGKTERTTDPELDTKIAILREQVGAAKLKLFLSCMWLQQRDYYKLLTTARGYTCYLRQGMRMQAEMAKAMQALAASETHTQVAASFLQLAHACTRANAGRVAHERALAEVRRRRVGAAAGGARPLQRHAGDAHREDDRRHDRHRAQPRARAVRRVPIHAGILTFPMASLHCRLEYDAYRSELARVQARAATTSGMNLAAEMHDAEQQVHTHQDTYEQLKKDVDVR